MVSWDPATTIEFSNEPLGSSVAAAVISCIAFGVCTLAAGAQMAYTGFGYYDVIIVSCLFRTVAYGVRAAYLVSYKPALGGVFLAFINSAFGTGTAIHSVAVIQWLSANGVLFFGIEQRYLLKWLSLLLCVAVIMFGLGCGVIASALEYGRPDAYVVTYGERLRLAATFGLAGVCASGMAVTARICWSVFITQREKADRVPATADTPERRPRLIAILLVNYALLGIRAAVAAVATYSEEEKYAKWWSNDRFYYPSCMLPELIVTLVDIYPTLYPRICQRYPGPLRQGKDPEAGQVGPDSSSSDLELGQLETRGSKLDTRGSKGRLSPLTHKLQGGQQPPDSSSSADSDLLSTQTNLLAPVA